MDYSDYTPNPETVSRVCFDAIPDALKARRQWVVWRREEGTKVPYRAIGEGKAATDDPSTWSTFAQAVRRYTERDDADGIGFVFTEDDPYTGVDLDHCVVNGFLTDYAADVVDGLDSYTEESPSGAGLHIIVEAILPHSFKTDIIELYDRGRYFTFTGKRWPGTRPDITERQGAIDIIVADLAADDAKPSPSQASQTPHPVTTPLSLEDQDIIERARRAENGAKFSALFDRGDTSGYGGDDSRADLALCSLIAFYTQDPNQIYRLVRQSALWRDKWDEVHRQRGGPATYAEMTIERALNRSEVYTSSVPVTLVNGKASQPSQASQTPQRGNLALAPADDHTETTTERGSEPLKLRMADVWQRDLLTLGRPPDVPPKREYVLDLLPVPSVNLWTGLPGGKKSILLMDGAVSEASGGIWLPRKGENVPYGDVQGQGRPVLWIDYDMGRDLTSERFYAMARHRGIEDLSSIPLHVLSVSAPMDLFSLQHAEELTELIRRLGAKFVVIDTLIDVKGAARENEDSMGVVFSNLRRISQEARTSINVIHHPAKNGSPDTPYRGFSGIAGKLDLGVTLAKRGYELTEPVDVSAFKVRGAPIKPFSAMFQYETHSADWRTLWAASFVAIAPPANMVGPQAIRDTFRDVLTQEPDLGKTDLIKKVYLKLMGQKVSRAQVEAEYYALLSDNQVIAEATGEKNKTAHRWVEGDE